MRHTAKIFSNGRSQAVRLPKEFRFQENEVFIDRDPETGNLIISSKPTDWTGLQFVLNNLKPPKDFLSKKERRQKTHNRDPFEGWTE